MCRSTIFVYVHNLAQIMINTLPLQLTDLSLGDNLLEGTLPELWSDCRSVRLYLDTVSDQ